jgi:hypothetical protein
LSREKDLGFGWLVIKICHAQDWTSLDFACCLVFYQNLLVPHIWLVKSMTRFLPNFGLLNL